jgi:hypothetical protein
VQPCNLKHHCEFCQLGSLKLLCGSKLSGDTHGAGSIPSALDIGGIQVLVGLKLAIEADRLGLGDRRRSDLAILVSMKFGAEVVKRRVPIPVLLAHREKV